MSTSDSSPLEADGFNCPSCGQAVQFGEDSAKLEHVDGTPMCTPGQEPLNVQPSALWPPVVVPPLVIPGLIAVEGDPEVSGDIQAAAQRANERARRLEVAHSRLSELQPYGTGKRGGFGWGVLFLFLLLGLSTTSCLWYVIDSWPR